MTIFDLLDAFAAGGSLNRTFFIMYGTMVLVFVCLTVFLLLKIVQILLSVFFTSKKNDNIY